MSLDPQVEELLGFIGQHLPELGSVPIDRFRTINSNLISAQPPGPDLHEVKDLVLSGPGGAVGLRLYVPQPSLPAGVILYFHGGGWAVGDVDGHDAPLRLLAQATDLPVVSVDYRLAPEHPFPAAVEDAYATLEWVNQNLASWFGMAVPLIVAGDSAGGNLAAAISIMARDLNGPEITAQVLLYPSVAGREFINSPELKNYETPFLSLKDIEWFIEQYVPDVEARLDPRFAPLFAPSLENLPPALVLTAQYDLLTAEAEAYSQTLRKAGNISEVHRYDGTVHGFFSLAPNQRQAMRAREDIKAFVHGVLRGCRINS
ncbi:alpha/beta hydrolase [Pseudomonas hunanensis]|uniref:Alpha/beta hydrolase n=1 Tax=Pseudomonas hunanensis TaxID=1247546 RepID=A0ABD6MU43_9PSED|nr:alpha/beta hydrolase [Pseudomonas hunanensis]NWL45051.1 alpha/beta hydrolase [Pseudomonas hunanensis]